MPMLFICSRCACAENGHTAAEPAITLMKSRRLIAAYQGRFHENSYLVFGFAMRKFALNNGSSWLSALGHKQTCAVQKVMSALPPIADIRRCIHGGIWLPVYKSAP